MIVLDATTKKIQALMDATATTTESPVVCSFDDIASSSTSYTAIASDTITNGATAVDIVAAPGASTQRLVKYISIYNADTVQHTCTVRYNDNATLRIMIAAVLPPASSLVYVNGAWSISVAPNQPYPNGYNTVTGSKTFALTDLNKLWLVTCGSSTNATLTLPKASTVTPGACIWLKKADAGTMAMLIQCNASDTIDGASSSNQPIIGTYSTGGANTNSGQYASYGLMCDGVSAWNVIECNGDAVYNYPAVINPIGSSAAYHQAAAITLTPGDWDINANFFLVAGAGGTISAAVLTVVTTSASGTGLVSGDNSTQNMFPLTSSQQFEFLITPFRVTITTTTTFYLNYNITWLTVAGAALCRLSARRCR